MKMMNELVKVLYIVVEAVLLKLNKQMQPNIMNKITQFMQCVIPNKNEQNDLTRKLFFNKS